jgi:hypothetical protein
VAAASPWEEHQSVPAQQGCACHFGLQCERLPAPRNGQARVRLDDYSYAPVRGSLPHVTQRVTFARLGLDATVSWGRIA